ncbi:flavin reductase family protein [Bradyrhizobium sp. U87765 SZCCT0131]|uniref:flavin reductase family protein n=1 Tax=unclassified Bradyrhizobium TaxID=2631580 RepID=UPI001BADDEBC|nr:MULTISPECIES: flavin reductase family protein [unclassified Bradyrhizobium]MBR1223049.1 flavin reductase family protein [Bradyrhizobium sp. U87765 SZCCT0131]MBR1262785.1 flavin reductase family protein [Bradyrhizobium sp. U87765 SZCCT0134]MBR1308743.1 flavin reductase family protein [Bradyrhizobium sp. U87765 SZCCT0110]MBR1318567.1 flavin reductase family protein [Bradyrhizobium sp. U87765 SZCCT0109]MBR1352271.1 flavin reductase family protein [Bradyrhizobium sp. U87765 SZCCT0048]
MTTIEQDTGFTARAFRDALGLFASGVVVVTSTTPEGERLGMTVSSFNSVSLEPPLVLFSVGRGAHAFAAWQAAETFAINVLAEEQSTISTRFARALTDKWAGFRAGQDVNGCPVLPGTLVLLSCTTHARHDGGDHLIIVGRVDALRQVGRHAARPLVFFGGQYRRLDADHAIEAPFDARDWSHGW